LGVTKSRKRLLVASLIALAILITGVFVSYANLFPVSYGRVMAVGVSDDGRYAISTHDDKRLVLWNLADRSSEVLSNNANIYSAYFVPGRDVFLWQDLEDVVRIQSVDGDTLKEFEHFPTYGHVISHDLDLYLSSDEEWNIFYGKGDDLEPVLNDGVSPSFVGTGKLMNLSLARERPLFITAGTGSDREPITDYSPIAPDRRFSRYGGVTLWSTETFEPVAKLPGNASKTHATISPDGQWVVSGDENNLGFFWNTEKPDERHRMASYTGGIYQDDTPYEPGDPRNWDDSGLIETPSGLSGNTIALAFISSDYFLRFGNDSHKAALFKAGNPWPQKYFDLGEYPKPVTYGSQYSRNTAIATSPEAGVLVMGHRSGGGISVYEFDAEALGVERTWVVR